MVCYYDQTHRLLGFDKIQFYFIKRYPIVIIIYTNFLRQNNIILNLWNVVMVKILISVIFNSIAQTQGSWFNNNDYYQTYCSDQRLWLWVDFKMNPLLNNVSLSMFLLDPTIVVRWTLCDNLIIIKVEFSH